MAIQMDRSKRSDVVKFLTKYVNSDNRRQIIDDTFAGETILSHFDVSGSPGVFASHLVSTTVRYGGLSDGTHSLVALLEEVGKYSGDAQKESIQVIKKIYPDYSKSTTASATTDNSGNDNTEEDKAPPKIFISYKREDEMFARLIAERLTAKGAHIWMDIKDIPVSVKWHNAIEEGLKECDVMLLVVTPEAMASSNVADEWEYFHSKRKPIIPLYRRNVDEMPFQLNRIQRVDFRYDFDAGYTRLENSLEQMGLSLQNIYIEQSSLETMQKDEKSLPKATSKISKVEERKPNLDKIKILFMTANPSDATRLRLGHEFNEVDARLRAGDYRDKFKLEMQPATRASQIREYMQRHKANIIHFSGHGDSSGALVFENNDGKATATNPQDLAIIFKILKKRIDIRCVILNACFSKTQAQAISEIVDCVVGMSDAINDETAIAFAASFYSNLSYGESIGDAFTISKAEVGFQKFKGADVLQLLTKPGLQPENIYLFQT